MSYYKHPDVDTLKVIADNWWKKLSSSLKANTPHDAQALTRLVSTSSWAVQDPYSECVARFVKWYRLGQTLDLQRMDDEKLRGELQKYLVDIDELFFFSVLTRYVDGKSGSQQLVRLMVTSESPKRDYCGAYSVDNKGPWIRLHRKDHQGKPRGFEMLLQTLVHESCHAYLDIFSDKQHRKYKDWVADFKGHGEMFWVLLRFIARRIHVFTKSERWKKQLQYIEEECRDTTKTSGEPGSWGTPERTLMGGVLYQ